MTVRARQKLKLFAVAGVLSSVLLKLNHQEVMESAFVSAMVHDDVWYYRVGLSSVALSDTFKRFSHLAIPIVLAVHIPRAAEMRLHMHGKTVSGRTFVNVAKFQRGCLSLQTFNGGSDCGSYLFVCHHRPFYAEGCPEFPLVVLIGTEKPFAAAGCLRSAP